MRYVIEGILGAALANLGAVSSIAYPSGTDANTFGGATGHRLVVNQSEYSDSFFSVTLGATINLINKTGKTLPAGAKYYLELQTYQTNVLPVLGQLVSNEYPGGPAVTTYDDGTGRKARIALVSSTSDDGWAGLDIGMNVLPSDNGTASRSDIPGPRLYQQFERDWDNGLGVLKTGTVSVAAGGTVVTGVGTLFLSEITVGGYYYFGGHSKLIKSVESNTKMTLAKPHTAGCVASAIRAKQGQNEWWINLADNRLFQCNALTGDPNYAYNASLVPLQILPPATNTTPEYLADRRALTLGGSLQINTVLASFLAGVGNSVTLAPTGGQATYLHYGATGDHFFRSASTTGGVTIQDGAVAGGFVKIGSSASSLGFHGVTPQPRQLLATGGGATVDNVITALQNIGLLRQS